MSEHGIDVVPGVGRIVWGHPTQRRKKTDQQNQPVLDANGQQVWETAFGVAYPKAEFNSLIWPSMHQEIATVWPNGVPARFAYKYVDGDTNDSKGQPYALREGYAGCIVLSITTRLDPPPLVKLVNGAYQQLTGEQIKCGDYVVVPLNLKCEAPKGTNTPSIYVNPRLVEFIAYGKEIVSAPVVDPMALLGGRVHALPPGASAAPLAPIAGMTAPGMAPPPAPGAPMAPPAAPGMPGAAPAYVPAAMTPPAPVAPPAPPPPAPPPPVAGPQRPIDPSHIAPDGQGGELWWNGVAWTPAPRLPPPAPDFVQTAMGQPVGAPGIPGMPAPR